MLAAARSQDVYRCIYAGHGLGPTRSRGAEPDLAPERTRQSAALVQRGGPHTCSAPLRRVGGLGHLRAPSGRLPPA